MPRSYGDFFDPSMPATPAAKNWAEDLEHAIEHDWAAAQTEPFPTRGLSWNAHDVDLQSIVGQYNNYLGNSPGYRALDWHLVKAMLFVETNANSGYWQNQPMQSANPHDLGFSDLTSSSNTAKMNLIVPLPLRDKLSSATSNAAGNITAGVGYLLFQAATFGQKIDITDPTVRTVTVSRHESLYGIARSAGTTEAILQKLNPSVNAYNLKPGMVLKYQKSGTVTVITGWRSIDANSIYGLYNRNPKLRDRYPEELNFAYNLNKSNRFQQ